MENVKQNAIDKAYAHSNLKGKVYRRKMLTPKRFKGLCALAATGGIF